MNANDFVEKIIELAPSKTELLNYGLSSKEINEIISLFVFNRRRNCVNEDCSGLIGFFECYRTNLKEVGGVTFLSDIIKFDDQLIFAKWDFDLFFQEQTTKKIYLRNEANNLFYFVGSSFEHFLDVIYSKALFIKNRRTNSKKLDDLRIESFNELVIKNGKETNEDFLVLFMR